MSTYMKNVPNPSLNVPPSAGRGNQSLGLNLSSGLEASVTAALSHLEQVLCKINNDDLKEYANGAKVNNKAAKANAASTIQNGKSGCTEAMAQGIGEAVGGGLSLGAMGVERFGIFGKWLTNPYRGQLEQLNVEIEGVNNYKSALPKKFNAGVNEIDPIDSPSIGQEEEVQRESQVDRRHAVKDRLEKLMRQKSFMGDDGKALEPSSVVKSEAQINDEQLIQAMKKPEALALEDALNSRLDELMKSRKDLVKQLSDRQQAFSAVGQGLSQVIRGSANASAATEKVNQGKAQAAAALAQAASQGIQSTMSQLLKTANDALQQAQQTIQTFATISNGNRFQG